MPGFRSLLRVRMGLATCYIKHQHSNLVLEDESRTIGRLAALVKASLKQKKRPQPKPGRMAAVRDLACPSGTPFVSAATILARDNGYLILAFQGRGDRKNTDIRLIAIDDSGRVSWDKVYGHDGFDLATSALATEDGGTIIAGATASKNGAEDIAEGGRGRVLVLVFRR